MLGVAQAEQRNADRLLRRLEELKADIDKDVAKAKVDWIGMVLDMCACRKIRTTLFAVHVMSLVIVRRYYITPPILIICSDEG